MLNIKSPGNLPPTEKFFHRDPYRTTCPATVLYVQGEWVVTDCTVFYAEAGGQAPDHGWIDSVPVVDVQKQPTANLFLRASETRFNVEVPVIGIATVVAHRCARPAPFAVGQRVQLRIDWRRRYLHMRNHSASHFLHYSIGSVYGDRGEAPTTIGCSITVEGSRFDLFGKLDPERIPEVAALANALIERGDYIHMEGIEQSDEIFFWRYGDIVIPCGGTHVRSSREVGPIHVRRKSKGKYTTRVYASLCT